MSRTETKARIPHMLVDTDFYEKPENLEAIDRFGDLAPACIMRVCFKLINEREARLKKSQVLSMWRATGTEQEKWADMIEYYISCGWLVEQDGYLSSSRVKKERARVEHKRSIMSANAKQKQNKSKTNDKQNLSISPDTDTDTDLNKNNSEPQIGLVKLSKYVRISEMNRDNFKMRCLEEKFTTKEAKEMVEALDRWFSKNPEKWREEDHYQDLCNWPMREAREHKLKLERAKGFPRNGIQKGSSNASSSIRPKGF